MEHGILHVTKLSLSGNIISMVMWMAPTNEEIYIASLYTLKEHRRKGYATALIEHLFSTHKGKKMSLKVAYDRTSKVELVKFYEKRGFKKCDPTNTCPLNDGDVTMEKLTQ